MQLTLAWRWQLQDACSNRSVEDLEMLLSRVDRSLLQDSIGAWQSCAGAQNDVLAARQLLQDLSQMQHELIGAMEVLNLEQLSCILQKGAPCACEIAMAIACSNLFNGWPVATCQAALQ